jgi:hypothetical protein
MTTIEGGLGSVVNMACMLIVKDHAHTREFMSAACDRPAARRMPPKSAQALPLDGSSPTFQEGKMLNASG